MKTILFLIIVSFLFAAGNNSVAQTAGKEWTKHGVKKWFKKKEWLGGLQMQPHKTVNKSEFARQYEANKVYWDKAFAFLREHDLQTLRIGRNQIDGDNVYALVTQNPTKDYDSTLWESHRNYIDLQYVISGEEKVGVNPITKLTSPYQV